MQPAIVLMITDAILSSSIKKADIQNLISSETRHKLDFQLMYQCLLWLKGSDIFWTHTFCEIMCSCCEHT